jgi:hypothetical protein
MTGSNVSGTGFMANSVMGSIKLFKQFMRKSECPIKLIINTSVFFVRPDEPRFSIPGQKSIKPTVRDFVANAPCSRQFLLQFSAFINYSKYFGKGHV